MSGSGLTASEHNYTAVLDLRMYDPRERFGMLQMTLNALQPGEDVLVLTAAEPARLLRYLEEQYAGDEWHWSTPPNSAETWYLHIERRRG